ncbi:MAG: hypothetical protein IJ093_02975 [Bacilli bacterium]|nr:hypothetical protein [Bacilli bacterium]
MRKFNSMRMAAVMFVAVLLTTCTISGTFAKYTSSSTGSDQARVAKWDIKLNNGAWSDTVSFDLFSKTYTNVSASEKVVAPGTEGEFTFTVKNDSEVTAKYSVDLALTNANNIPLEFSVNGGAYQTPTGNKLTLATDDQLAIGSTAKTVTVAWRWVYEADGNEAAVAAADATDTTLGLAGTATVKVDATIVATQVD